MNPVGEDQIIFDLETLPELVGREFLGGWFTVASEQILQFDASTFVVDDDYGTSLEDYPVGMLEGMHTLGIIPQFVDSGLRMEDDDAYGLVYGFDRVRFVTRTFVGDRLRCRGVVRDVTPRGHGYVTRLDCTIEIDGKDTPAYVAQWLVLYLPVESAVRARAEGGQA